MPLLTVLFVRCSLMYLVVGFTIGMLLLWQKVAYLSAFIWRLLPLHLELLTFGWIVQLVIGVAFWILPRFGKPPVRGNETVVWISLFALNAGVLLVGFQGFLPDPDIWALCGRVLEMAAVVCFAVNAWPRIKPFGL